MRRKPHSGRRASSSLIGAAQATSSEGRGVRVMAPSRMPKARADHHLAADMAEAEDAQRLAGKLAMERPLERATGPVAAPELAVHPRHADLPFQPPEQDRFGQYPPL